VVPGEVAQSPSDLYEVIKSERVTILNQTPAALRQLLAARRAASQAQPDWSVRLIICGGDALDQELAGELARLSMPVWNFYGPTESTVWATANLVEKLAPRSVYDDAQAIQSPRQSQTQVCGVLNSIGRPLPDIQVYLLDRRLQPVPVGVAGELFIGGAGLARGYFKRPALCAEKFVPDPFGGTPGARLYRTGDLASFRGDGRIEFLGRIDHQVKLRGFRIELGEIEVVLTRHPDLSEAVVVIREDRPGDQRLVAYVVADKGRKPSAGELRTFLQPSLPDYMMPSLFVALDALPLTANKKVDRGALATRADSPSEAVESYVPPRTAAEEIIANVWARVLGLERVGINDNFFLLGGHSLLATQVIARIRDALHVDVSLRALFQHPTVAGLASRLDRFQAADEFPPLVPVPRGSTVPASFAQQRLWFLDQLDPGSTYNMSRALRLKGRLDLTALRKALNAMVARHESLRTNFGANEGEPVQIVGPPRELPVTVLDLTGLPTQQREAEGRRLAAAASLRPFDLAADQLLRASLFRFENDDHVLLLVTHHIVSDGWSMTILLHEIGTLYESFASDKPSPLLALPIQYADFSLWQRDWLRGSALQKRVDYWRQQLAGAPTLLELPTDRVRPAVQTSNGTYHSTLLPKVLSDALAELSRHEGVTLFMTLLAAFQTMLLRYTQQEDIVVGTPIANRNLSETEGLIGYFANTLVIRSDLSGNPTFRELLRRIREVTLEAYAHQELPFEKLVEELQPDRSLSHMPLVQVLFALQNIPRISFRMADLEAGEFSYDRQTSKLDLSLYVRETDAGLAAWFEYSTDLFDAATIERMAGHFQTILEGIAADPHKRIADLPLLTESEQNLLLVEWNDTQTQFPVGQLIHQVFEAQVERLPGAIAVVCEDERPSYAELNRKANRLARYLKRRGVGPDILVGVFVERSVEMIVALLAVLKAGGAYVPFDLAYPRNRLSFMLQDAGVKLIVTQRALTENLPACETEIIFLDEDSLFAPESDENPAHENIDDNLAYVIYTSGSTGKPKGVAVNHSSVMNLLQATGPLFSFSASDVWTVTHSYAFDFSVWEIFGALLSGGRLVVVPRAVAQSPAEFYGLLCDEKVTVLGLTPSALRQLAAAKKEAAATARDAPLRLVVCGGEAFPCDLVTDLLDWNVPLWNFFGPTEASVWVAMRAVEAADVQHKFVPLGHAIANTQIFLLDRGGRIVPVGVAGELCIGGAALARCYLNRPGLTAERFIPNPFSRRAGERLYRTGDIARYLPNGTILYVGRADQQIKLRGFRIELGEIEAVLSGHSCVGQCVVVIREDEPGQPSLVAYVVAVGDAPSVTELRDFLTQKLPEYMTPASFVMLDALPLNSNGKIDRLALPTPGHARPDVQVPFVAPRTPLEGELAEIWSTVLKRKRVGVVDNFFELGGHSLLATQLVSRIRARLNVELPLRRLFESPTIEGLAVAITAGERTSTPTTPTIRRRSRRDAEKLRAKVEKLSEEEVDSLLTNVRTRTGSDH
jgi:amino acid adenylation domain-containing protein